MPLHLVGNDLHKVESHRLAEAGVLLQLMRGVYVDAADDVDAMVLQHAIRIARYLYPNAYLSAASAVLLAPTGDGRLFITSRRHQRTRLRGLEIIQFKAPKQPSTDRALIQDSQGEFQVAVSSIRQRFLEAFRARSEQAASMPEDMRRALMHRLVEEYGTPKSAADAVWALARDNEWYAEGEAAERFLLRIPLVVPVVNQAAMELLVAWHGQPLGHLRHDGFEWTWVALQHRYPPLIRQTIPGQLPPFIEALLPEGWLESILHERDERALVRSGRRYTSNIAIVEHQAQLPTLPADQLMARLQEHAPEGVFTGHYAGPGRGDLHHTFERNLAQIFAYAETPHLSSVQIKAPMHLDANGTLETSTHKPFTHILKPAGTGGFEHLPIIEYLAMELGRKVGLTVPATALVNMPDGLPPALLVERFDIREGADDRRMIALEDMCSALGLSRHEKYQASMERVAQSIRALSSAPDVDLMVLFRRALFAWLIADGDLHLKNMALLKIAGPGGTTFRSVRMAPLYDAVTTRVFPRLREDRLALKLSGKDDNIRPAELRLFASAIGLKGALAEEAMEEMLARLRDAIAVAALPTGLSLGATDGDAAQALVEEMLGICRNRVQSFV